MSAGSEVSVRSPSSVTFDAVEEVELREAREAAHSTQHLLREVEKVGCAIRRCSVWELIVQYDGLQLSLYG